MKSATLPSLRVDPELREAAEGVLQDGETLSGFIETSVRVTIERRRTRAEFVARGLASRDEARSTGVYIGADAVHAELGRMLNRTSSTPGCLACAGATARGACAHRPGPPASLAVTPAITPRLLSAPAQDCWTQRGNATFHASWVVRSAVEQLI